ncbi:APC family permease [Thermogymnomonas acidicola]|uniref:APC family permease n=1 Tax=Thermogymnomonas acidicola TaxID=399579 RepID=UPI001E552487|nr:APC family permease [Thermogymnomonas acidicola]
METRSEIRQGEYRKEIGVFGATFFGASAILGSAILFIPVTVLSAAGPEGIVAWVIGAVMMLVIGLIYTELGTIMPRTGGVGTYPQVSNGPLTGIFNGWGAFLGYVLAPVSEVVAMVEYLSFFFPVLYNLKTSQLTIYGELLTILIVFLFFLGNYFGVRYLNQANSFLTWLKLLSLAFIGVFFLALYFHPSNFTALPGGFAPYGGSGLLFAVATTVYAYAGFRQPVDYAEEVKDHKRTIPIAISLSIIVSFILYTLLSVDFIGSVNWSYLGISPGDWASLSSLTFPLPAMAFGVGLAVMAYFIFFTSIHSSASSSLIYSGGAARVLANISENRYLPPFFARLGKRGVPYYSVIAVLLISAFYTFLVPVFISVALVFVDASLVSYGPAAVSLMVFRRHVKAPGDSFRLPAAQVLAPIGFVVGSYLLYWTGFKYLIIAIPSVLVGALLFIYHARKTKVDAEDIRGGIWYPVYLAAILALSYFLSISPGPSNLGGIDVVPFPYNIIVFTAVVLVFYAVGVISGNAYMAKKGIRAEGPPST